MSIRHLELPNVAGTDNLTSVHSSNVQFDFDYILQLDYSSRVRSLVVVNLKVYLVQKDYFRHLRLTMFELIN